MKRWRLAIPASRPWITVLSVLSMALVPASAAAQERPWEWGWGMHPGWWMWGVGGAVMMLMMVVFWGLVIASLVLGIRWLARPGQPGRPDRALDILRERYARGDLTREEFEARRRDLEGRAA
jgi:putative membrane protein